MIFSKPLNKNILPNWKLLSVFMTLATTSCVLYKNRNQIKTFFKISLCQLESTVNPWSMVIYFPDAKSPCKDFLFRDEGCYRKSSCKFSHDKNSSMYKLIQVVMKAKCTIHLCMYRFNIFFLYYLTITQILNTTFIIKRILILSISMMLS